MGKSYLAFDLGASSGRGIIGKVVNGKLELKEIHRFKNFPIQENGHFHWDLAQLLNEIKTGIKKAYAVDPTIESMSIDTWGVDYALFRDGKLIRNPYNYRDGRTKEVFEELHRIIPAEELYRISGIQDMNINTIYQLYAHKKMHPEDFTNNAKMLMIPDALLYLLSGAFSSEYTISSTTGLLDARSGMWAAGLLARLGIPFSIFPPVTPPSVSMPLKKEIYEELGVPPILTVKTTSHDTASAVAATPATKSEGKHLAYISSGTWALLGAELPGPVLDQAAARAHFTNEGGICGSIRFLTNIMGTWLLQETKRTWNEAGREIGFGEMSELAGSVKATKFRIDPNCEDFLAPCDMPAKIRAYCERTGQGKIDTDAELLRCIYDSLAECFAAKLKELEGLLGERVEVLHILGGAIRDKLLMQLTADKTGCVVVTGPVEATATGNILSQMLTSGELRNLTQGRKLVADSFGTGTFRPGGK